MFFGPWEGEHEENAVVSIWPSYGEKVNVVLGLEGLRWVFQNQKDIDKLKKFS